MPIFNVWVIIIFFSGTNKAHQLIGQQQLSTSIKVKQSKVRSMQASQAQINQVVAQAPGNI